jgi:ectoine hydroxylase-related dioxygenase (phytanoyl-CoA dioxygenase family)
MAAYTELRGRLSALLTDVSDETGATVMVPGCPEWSVIDAVAHVGGDRMLERRGVDG